jgi:hypothetical protein
MGRIVDAIYSTLNAFPRISKEDKLPGQELEEFNIFIADVADTLQNTKKRLIEDLKGKNILIPKSIPPPMENSAHETDAAKAIGGAGLAVHLLDELPGRSIIDMETSTYPRRQVEIGLQSETQQLIMVPQGLDYENIENKGYANFLKSLEYGNREEKAYGFIRFRKTYLSQLVLKKITRIQQQKETAEAVGDSSILLATHQKDQRFAFKLAEFLDSNGFKVAFNQEFKDHAASLHGFEKSLKHVSSLLIIFGQVAPAWVRERLKIMMKFIASQLDNINKIALKNCGIVLLPSSKITDEIDRLTKLSGVKRIDNRHSNNLDKSVVKPLLERKNEWGLA